MRGKQDASLSLCKGVRRSEQIMAGDQTIDSWFKAGVWLDEWNGQGRLVEVRLKITPAGTLAILKFITGEGPMVGFHSGPGPSRVLRDLYNKKVREGIVTRPDRFALDNLEKKV